MRMNVDDIQSETGATRVLDVACSRGSRNTGCKHLSAWTVSGSLPFQFSISSRSFSFQACVWFCDGFGHARFLATSHCSSFWHCPNMTAMRPPVLVTDLRLKVRRSPPSEISSAATSFFRGTDT